MEPKDIAKQMIFFQKNLFENIFNAMKMIQDQTEDMVNHFMEQLPWLPPDARQSVQHSIDAYKAARTDFKKVVDDGFDQLDDILSKS